METIKITSLAVIAFVAASPGPVSIIVSIIFGFYIMNMLYFNIVKIHYRGSWKLYIMGLFNRFLKKK